MDLERLPSEHFSTNSDIMTLALMAYNLLRLCGQESLREDNGNLEKRASHRKKAQRRRLRTVMQDLIYMASRISCHARRMYLSFGRYNPWSDCMAKSLSGFYDPHHVGGNAKGCFRHGPLTIPQNDGGVFLKTADYSSFL